MALSTEETVRDVFVNAIKAIAQSDLGFDQPNGNVRDYPFEWHQEEDLPPYFTARAGGKQKVRCIAVDVRAHDDLYAVPQIPKRRYLVRIFFYYAKETNGTAYKAMVTHARKVRGGLNAISPVFQDTVDLIESTQPLEVTELKGLDVGVKVLQGTMSYVLVKVEPDF